MINTDGATFTGGPMQHPCPACGYCPCCGRQAGPVVPYVPVYPMPYYPVVYPMPWNPFAPQPWTVITVSATDTTGCAEMPLQYAAAPDLNGSCRLDSAVNTIDFRGVQIS